MLYKIFLPTLPVLMGYLPLGIAFGILFSQLNLPWYYCFLTAFLIFTGAGQFLLISLLAVHAGFFQIALASFLLNIRHLFYSLPFTKDLKKFGIGKYYILFGLTDETFAVLNSTTFKEKDKERFYLLITFINHFYWVSSCMAGVLIGENLGFKPQGIEFALTSLFTVLMLSLLFKSKNKIPFYIGVVISIFGLIIFPSEQFFLLTILLGILILFLGKKWISNE